MRLGAALKKRSAAKVSVVCTAWRVGAFPQVCVRMGAPERVRAAGNEVWAPPPQRPKGRTPANAWGSEGEKRNPPGKYKTHNVPAVWSANLLHGLSRRAMLAARQTAAECLTAGQASLPSNSYLWR